MESVLPQLAWQIDRVLLLPAGIALGLLLLEHVAAVALPASLVQPRFPVIVALRWLWPVLLLGWTLSTYPDMVNRLHVSPPESPRHMLSAAGAVFGILIVTAVMWWWIAPPRVGPALPFGPDTLQAPWRLIILAGEALAHQITFALLRAPALSSETAWGIGFFVGILVYAGIWMTARVRGRPFPRYVHLLTLGLTVGTGLVLSGYSLWAALVWEWLFLVAVSL